MADVEMIAAAGESRGKLADAVVLLAMTAFSLALAVGFNHQLGLPMWLAGCVAASIFAGCLALHVLLVRSVRLQRLEAEVARLSRKSASGASEPHEARRPATVAAPGHGADAETPKPAVGARPEVAPAAAIAPVQNAPAPETVPGEVAKTGPAAEEATPQPAIAAIAQAVAAAPAPANPRPTDFETIQTLVRKLAADVEASERQGAEPEAAATDQAVPAIEASIDALRTTAESMLRAETATRPTMTADAVSAYRPGESGHVLPMAPAPLAGSKPARPELIALASALQGQRIDVMLEPILGLREQRASHYEISLRFHDERGGSLDFADRPAELSGSGLLPLIDIARLSRTAEVARRLKDRGTDGSVFSDLAAESLVDDDFLNRVAAAYRAQTSFADGLVMSFSQIEARTFTPAQWETLLHMRDLGFRFALKDVTDLDMDFEALAKTGFQFAKLDAEVFLVGLPMDGGVVPSRDICRHLAGAGLTLIVGHIEDEHQLIHVLGFGALLGQGSLFGEPRPMRAELFARPAVAAA